MTHGVEPLPPLDAAFLASVLPQGSAGEPSVVVDVRHERLGGTNAFNATILRLFLTYDPASAPGPRTLIAKLPTADTELHARASVLQPGRREQWFYRRAAPRVPVRVPRCYYSRVDRSTGESLLLLEDLTAHPTGDWLAGATLRQARVALRSLARLHARWWGASSDPAIQELATLVAPQGQQELVQSLFDAAWPRFAHRFSTRLTDDLFAFGAAIVGNMAAVDRLGDQAPSTLAHGDFRLDNLHFGTRAGTFGCWLIDWEDVFFGSSMVDVSWFLGGCLPLALRQHEMPLLRHYHRALLVEGVGNYSWEHCLHDYRCGMCSSFVQGILTATRDAGAEGVAAKRARAVGRRFVDAAQRLRLLELIV